MKVYDIIEDKGFDFPKVVVATFTDEQVAVDVAYGKNRRAPRNALGVGTSYYAVERQVSDETWEQWLANCTG